MPITEKKLHNIFIIALILLAVLVLYSTIKKLELISLIFFLAGIIFITI